MVKEILNRNMKREVCRLEVPLQNFVKELRLANEYYENTGIESVRAFEILRIIWNVLEGSSLLLQENYSFENEIGRDQQVWRFKELRRTIMKNLNIVNRLFTSPLGNDKISERIYMAHDYASKCCEEDIPKLIGEIDASGDDYN